jgi:diacylglycerol kinase (ATP)
MPHRQLEDMKMRTKVIINSKAGRGRSERLRELLRKMLGSDCESIESTTYAGHAAILARDACQNGFDTIVVVGGDGTINEVVNGAIGADVAIGIVPTGTANDLARYHHIPLAPKSACNLILQCHCRYLDVIRVNGWHYLTVAGLGLPCEAVEEAEFLRHQSATSRAFARLLGSKLYLLALALTYRRSTRRGIGLRITAGQMTWFGAAFSVIVANQPFLGHSFCVSPSASNNDGRLDLFTITDTHDRQQLLETVLSTVIGGAENADSVVRLQTTHLTIEASEALPIFADGELHGSSKCFDFQVVPQAIKLIAPCEEGV